MTEELNTLLTQLRSDDPNVKQNALDKIGKINPEGALGIVLPFLKDQDSDVRGMAAFSLGDIQDTGAIPHLLKFLEQEQDKDLRSYGFSALENYQDPTVLQYLLSELDKPPSSRLTRQHVARQLRKFDTDASIAALITLLQEDEDWVVQDYAADGLLILNRVSLRPIWETALEHYNNYVQVIAKKAIIQIKHRTARKKPPPRQQMRKTRKAKYKCRKH